MNTYDFEYIKTDADTALFHSADKQSGYMILCAMTDSVLHIELNERRLRQT